MPLDVRHRIHALIACASSTESDADDWHGVANPFLSYPDVAVKDAFLVREKGTWHAGYSEITESPFRVRLGFATSNDLVTFARAPAIDQPDTGGLASPTVVRAPNGTFLMTYNSHTHDVGTSEEKLYYRTSSDLVTWSDPIRIHLEGADADGDRLIDASLAFADPDVGAFLFFKNGQTAQVAHSASGSVDGPWKILGDLTPTALENYQAIRIDGVWHLLGTSLPIRHRPILHRLTGDPRDPAAWRNWTVVRELEVEEQSWNTGGGSAFGFELANAGYLVDSREDEGFFYLVYAGSTDVSSYQGRGHATLGIARSRDLVNWRSAPAR